MITPNFKLEKKLFKEGYDFVIGVDEAGRGPLAGPVVACAAVWRNPKNSEPSPAPTYGRRHPLPQAGEEDFEKFTLIRDSKTLSEKQRESLFDFICEHFFVGVGICDHKTVDRINILEASFLAMKKAVGELVSSIKYNVSSLNKEYIVHDTKYIILVDGNKVIPNCSHNQRAVINGDKIVKSISAASIIAKVMRDRLMIEMHKKYPDYGFNKHKGYGTKMHFRNLKEYGPCEIHRRSFAPVGKLLKK